VWPSYGDKTVVMEIGDKNEFHVSLSKDTPKTIAN
jgi:hypothetical protein